MIPGGGQGGGGGRGDGHICAPYLTGPSSSNTKPILVKFLVLYLMGIPNKLMIPGWCGGQVGDQSRVKVGNEA